LTAAAFGLVRMGVRFDHLLHSPLLRAVETAQLLGDLSMSEPEAKEALAEPPDEALLHEIGRLEGVVAVVGHLPWVAEMVSWLTFGRVLEADRLHFSPGTIAALEGSPVPGGMRLAGLWQPGDFT
ncbi:MAG: SixA phosphatase family protein, partial [Myxococcota bacterium]